MRGLQGIRVKPDGSRGVFDHCYLAVRQWANNVVRITKFVMVSYLWFYALSTGGIFCRKLSRWYY